MNKRITRRSFIKSAAFGVAAMKTGPAIAQTLSANEKLNIAMVGIGGQGLDIGGQFIDALQHRP